MSIKAQDIVDNLIGDYNYLTKEKENEVYAWVEKPSYDCVKQVWLGGRWSWCLYAGLLLNVDFGTDDYSKCIVEKKESFEITGTGLYKTRNGDRAFVSFLCTFFEGVVENIMCSAYNRTFKWSKDGVCRNSIGIENDIIAKWGKDD